MNTHIHSIQFTPSNCINYPIIHNNFYGCTQFICIPVPVPISLHSEIQNNNIVNENISCASQIKCKKSTYPSELNTKTTESKPINVKPLNKYKCTLCVKTFKHKTNLKIHSKIHSSEAFVCEFCQKRFARKTNMAQHLRVHTGEKPFKCDKCSKGFQQKHSLLDHMNIHTGERPYKCEYCPKSFTSKCNYMVHRRTHTGEKPYKCTICGKRFTSKSGYNAHQKSKH
eukprot:527458_1